MICENKSRKGTIRTKVWINVRNRKYINPLGTLQFFYMSSRATKHRR